ncbi:ATP-binding protein [Streptomyces sp. NBC_00237]|uniref:ATP-binding protein n=1 Tax=Streptomyces sp. NBC_00237 TaxID=2975687 RepID=UPI002253CAD7|nr:ATP-binding protein [Streptomyces sp. NBC_00237]MCX5199978.1 ATP-binding protein [Streptomyces sp. NBC_00237]
MSIWWSLHLRREAASVPLARRLLLDSMNTAGVDPDISYDLSVALSEACANAVEHGGDDEPGPHCAAYRVTAYLDGDTCRIEVTDSGPGFPAVRRRGAGSTGAGGTGAGRPGAARPAAHLRENGRGLRLIEQLADHVHFRNRPGRGAVVSFDKILKWREGALLQAS